MERIRELVDPLDAGELTLFKDNPIEFLCATMACELQKIPQWSRIYGEYIDGYMRMDYDFRNLPALRIYNETGSKDGEHWFINGDIKCDSMLPASIRREETQQVQDTLTGALLQQLRSQNYFQAVEAKVPGLNELGKIFSWDKTLGFNFEDQMVPLTQITLNFRLDLRIWDDYLVANDRTVDDPFCATLANLEKIYYKIQALRDDGENGPAIPQDGSSQIILKGGS
jgi:hypothetical protein